jgi:translocation and assembly module TamA
MRQYFFIMAMTAALLWAGSASADPVRVVYVPSIPDEVQTQIDERLSDEPAADGPLHARRQGRRAKKTVEGVLNAYGYFDPRVVVSVVGDGPNARAELTVEPGVVFAVRRLVIRYEGTPPFDDDQEQARAAISLQPGMDAVAAKVIDQERQLGARLRQLGYPYAQATGREVIGDKEDKTISVRYTVKSGPRVRFGDVAIPDGLRTSYRYLNRINSTVAGTLFDPAALALYNSRLSETRLFNKSIAKLSDAPVAVDADGTEVRDVELQLTERKRNTLTLGVGFDTSEGFGVDAELLRRNLTRRGDLLTATARAAERELGLELVWRRPNVIEYGKGLRISASASDENTDAFNQVTGRVGVGYEVIKSPEFQYNYGADARYIRQSGESARRDFQVLSLSGAVLIDESDSLLDPRRGWRAEGRLKPTYSFSPDGPDVPYVRAVGQLRGYVPLSSQGRFVAAGRLRLGTLVGATVADVPGEDRFYSGGGGSVRGYAFQAIGPFDANDVPLGGRSLTEGSIEARARVTTNIGVVGFVDAGTVSNEEYPTFDNFRLGAGIGVRYITPAGPLRLDIATPLNPSGRDEAVQVYISIGQAF